MTDHKAVNQWMLGNGWRWVDDFSNLSKTVPGHWFKPEHPYVSQDLAAEMYRMAEGMAREALASKKPRKKVVKQSGVLSIDEVKERIDKVLCDYITCDDCGGYGFDHDRSDDSCNYCAMYEKVDDAKAKILNILTVNQAFGIKCASDKHLLGLSCQGCQKKPLDGRSQRANYHNRRKPLTHQAGEQSK